MKHAETVTFGGSGLERAAHLRNNPQELAALFEDNGQVLMVWRGKPLVQGPDNGQLVWVDARHPMVASATKSAVFLGLEGGKGLFAVDVSHWTPDDLDTSTLNQFLDPSEQVPQGGPAGAVFAELRAVMTKLDARDAECAATARAVLEWHRTHGFCAFCGHKTMIGMAGWQTDCAACGRHHFPRTDPVVIMLILSGNSVLLGRSPGWPEGMYSLLAGFIEPGETIEAAVRREVQEESGVHVGQVGYLASQPWPFPASLMFGCIGHATSTEIKIDPEEIEDALWVTREEMMQIFAGEHPKVNAPRQGAIAHFLLQNWLADTLD
ncbi:NAD(+) diphosphatase [Algirhabdus cladophorae]|uniref:NAD(+) diphosphatase n=1 Tax=Algirhabdus cladophorae TaxID=3377108 RepID=UPI003B84A59F